MTDATIDPAPVAAGEPTRAAVPPGRFGGDLRLGLRQIGYEQRGFWRNRSRAFFSIAFPLVFLVVFNAINGGDTIKEMGGISYATWFIPGILAYGLMMATFANLAVSTAIARDNGLLKRLRGTPLPPWAYLTGVVGSTLVTAVVLVVVTLTLGVVAYGVEIQTGTLVGLILTLVLGTSCFTVLGLAATAIMPNGDAASAITNLILLPLTFISGIWFVMAGTPAWLDVTAKIFPVRALAHGLQFAFDPRTSGNGVSGFDLAVLAIWTLIGVVAYLRFFRWTSDGTRV